jgi:hypothetical protein
MDTAAILLIVCCCSCVVIPCCQLSIALYLGMTGKLPAAAPPEKRNP